MLSRFVEKKSPTLLSWDFLRNVNIFVIFVCLVCKAYQLNSNIHARMWLENKAFFCSIVFFLQDVVSGLRRWFEDVSAIQELFSRFSGRGWRVNFRYTWSVHLKTRKLISEGVWQSGVVVATALHAGTCYVVGIPPVLFGKHSALSKHPGLVRI